MYEDLVKSLKICGTSRLINENCIAFYDGCCEAEPGCMYKLMRQAADAIEELSRDLDCMNDANIALYGALPKWISVTERLPKINSDMYSDDLIVCMRRFDGENYYYEKFAGYRTSNNIWYTYQHDNCSQVGIEQHMKHCRETADVIVAWMHMPEPYKPKEGE